MDSRSGSTLSRRELLEQWKRNKQAQKQGLGSTTTIAPSQTSTTILNKENRKPISSSLYSTSHNRTSTMGTNRLLIKHYSQSSHHSNNHNNNNNNNNSICTSSNNVSFNSGSAMNNQIQPHSDDIRSQENIFKRSDGRNASTASGSGSGRIGLNNDMSFKKNTSSSSMHLNDMNSSSSSSSSSSSNNSSKQRIPLSVQNTSFNTKLNSSQRQQHTITTDVHTSNKHQLPSNIDILSISHISYVDDDFEDSDLDISIPSLTRTTMTTTATTSTSTGVVSATTTALPDRLLTSNRSNATANNRSVDNGNMGENSSFSRIHVRSNLTNLSSDMTEKRHSIVQQQQQQQQNNKTMDKIPLLRLCPSVEHVNCDHLEQQQQEQQEQTRKKNGGGGGGHHLNGTWTSHLEQDLTNVDFTLSFKDSRLMREPSHEISFFIKRVNDLEVELKRTISERDHWKGKYNELVQNHNNQY